jgi:hypothetical protein
MKLSSSGDYVFTLRHMWTSNDLGLLTGYPLDGVLRVTAGVAHSWVFVPFGAVALLGGFCVVGGLGMLAVFTADPSGWNLVCLSFWVWISYVLLWRNPKRAVGPVSEDAVALLRASQQRSVA